MTKISAVIITLNEEHNIKRCVIAAKKVADEVIILDSFSSDKTVEIAENLKCKVIQQKWLGYSAQKNKANSLANYDYILSLDADEEIGTVLVHSILKEKENGLNGAYSFSRLTNYCGTWVRHGGWYPDEKTRLFPKAGTLWTGEFVHELLELPANCETKKLNGDLNHYSYYSYTDHRKRAAKYSELNAKKMQAQQKSSGPLKPYLSGFAKFISMYFFSLGILDGKMGFMIAWISAEASVNKYKILNQLNKA